MCSGYSVIHLTGHYNTQCCVGHIEKSAKGWWDVISYTDSSLNTNRATFNEAREYELYLKYGILYADYAEEHPIRYPDPNRPTYYTEDDWDDYKESFMEYLETYEEEQKRKAALAAQPVIPGLLEE